jgi:hypothetical protein
MSENSFLKNTVHTASLVATVDNIMQPGNTKVINSDVTSEQQLPD